MSKKNSSTSLSVNTKFLDKLIINPTKVKSLEVSNLLNSLLSKVYTYEHISNIDKIDFTKLDENQTWSYIENITKNPITNFKKVISTENETNNSVLSEIKTLKNSYLNEKRKRDEELKMNEAEEEEYEDNEEGEEENDEGEDLDEMGEKGEDDYADDDDFFDQQEFEKIGDDDFDFGVNRDEDDEDFEEEEAGDLEEGNELEDPKDLTFKNFFGKLEKKKKSKILV